jgi:TRAP-type C4-dicarboxylate transport system substrate-binding protein
MIRRTLLAGLAAGAMFAAAPAAAQSTKWNLPAAYSNTNYHTENLIQFAKDVETATGGKLVITVHGNASLFKAPDIKKAVVTGQAQMGEVLISNHENEEAVFGIDVVPFLATSFADSQKLWDASKGAIEKKLEAQGLKVLFVVPWGPQGIYSAKELKTVDDMKGLKFRSYNVGTTRIAELAGAQSVTIQAAELPQALATGVVNSFISSGSTGYDSKVWESLKFWYDTQAWIPKNITFVNKAVFDALPKDQQDAVLAQAKIAQDRGWKIAQEKAGWYITELKAKGMTVEPPSPAFAASLKKFGEDLTAGWLKRAGKDGEDIVAAFRK